MFTVKWIGDNDSEMIYAARDVSYSPPSDDKSKAGVSFYILGSGEQKGDVHCSIDAGRVYVMNSSGKTIAHYELATKEFPHGLAPRQAA